MNLMRKKIKKLLTIIFVLFVIISFTAITVIVIIIAQGGKVTNNGLEKTGIIKITSQPENDIDVYVNDKKTSLNDKRIENLDPGTYIIRIEKKDYMTWTKQVEVEKGIVKELFVTLFPNDLELEQMTSINIDRTFFSPDGSYLVYTVKNGSDSEKGIWKLKLTQNAFGLLENKPERIISLNEQIQKILSGNYSCEISQNNERFLLLPEDQSTQLLLNMNQDNSPDDLTDITNVGFAAETLTWFEQGDSIILEKDNALYEYVISDNTTRLIYQFSDTPIYGVNGRTLIFYTNSKYYIYEQNKKAELSPKGRFDLPAADNIWLSSITDKNLYIKSGETIYYVNLEEGIYKVGDYNMISISPRGNAAIVSSQDNKVYVFGNEYLPAIDEMRTQIVPIKENYNPNDTVYSWSPDSTQIIVREINPEKQENSIILIDNYGVNDYEILKSSQVKTTDYYLANDSTDFVILLADSSSENESNTTYNLYKIHLID